MTMYFFARSYSIESSGVLRGRTDWHCHILPGVDDGIPTLDDSLEVLEKYEALGIREAWLTPHIMEDIPNRPDDLKARFAELEAAYKGPVILHLAAENMLDNLFEERFEAGDLLPIGSKGDHLLVETSYFNPPMDLFGTLERIRRKGFTPLLAHPERYVYMEESDYARLRAAGVAFQINLTSLAGAYGNRAKEKAEKFLRQNRVECTGTDLHRLADFCRIIARPDLKKGTVEALERF